MRLGWQGLGGGRELLPQGGVRRKRNLTGSSFIEGGRVKQWAAILFAQLVGQQTVSG